MPKRRTLKTAINDDIAQEKELASFVFQQTQAKASNNIQETSEGLLEVPIKSIHRTKIQQRRYFDEEKIKEWAENEIKPNGIRSPLWVRPLPNGNADEYELIAGERRYRAALHLKHKSILVRVFKLSDKQALLASLVENMQRQDLNPLEETEGTIAALSAELECSDQESIKLLYQMNNASKGKINQNVLVSDKAKAVEAVFSTLGRLSWRSFVSARLPLLKKPEDILVALREGRIDYTKAILISKIKDDFDRNEVLEQAIEEGWSLGEVKEHVTLLLEIKESDKENSIEKEVKAVFKAFKQSKSWKDPKKKKQVEKLLDQMRKLIDFE